MDTDVLVIPWLQCGKRSFRRRCSTPAKRVPGPVYANVVPAVHKLLNHLRLWTEPEKTFHSSVELNLYCTTRYSLTISQLLVPSHTVRETVDLKGLFTSKVAYSKGRVLYCRLASVIDCLLVCLCSTFHVRRVFTSLRFSTHADGFCQFDCFALLVFFEELRLAINVLLLYPLSTMKLTPFTPACH